MSTGTNHGGSSGFRRSAEKSFCGLCYAAASRSTIIRRHCPFMIDMGHIMNGFFSLTGYSKHRIRFRVICTRSWALPSSIMDIQGSFADKPFVWLDPRDVLECLGLGVNEVRAESTKDAKRISQIMHIVVRY